MGSHTPFSNNRDNIEQQEQHSLLGIRVRLTPRQAAKIYKDGLAALLELIFWQNTKKHMHAKKKKKKRKNSPNGRASE